MNRRDFVTSLICAPAVLPAADSAPSTNVTRVLVVFKCHLDVGFTNTQAAVMRLYFDQHFPNAIQRAEAMRQAGSDRYVWTTGSWLLWEYLEQASTEQRRRIEAAIAAGELAWHALPFTWQTEVLDRSMVVGGLGFSQSLDRRFGRTTTGAKMTDVPGHTRSIVPPLAENGIKLLDIGVNSASTPPDVPDLFRWQEPGGASIVVMYHRKEYGGVVEIPGSGLAVAIEMRGDNGGPHSVEEIQGIYRDLRRRFPGAEVRASTLTEVADAVYPFRGKLPVVRQEIGDTWIYGVPSDPIKVARFREVSRLRNAWIKQGQWHAGDAADLALLRRLLLVAEHTWGTDTKTYLDMNHYTPSDLAKVLDTTKYRIVTASWAEKRDDIDQGVATLPQAQRTQAIDRLRALNPVKPSTEGLKSIDPGSEIETTHFVLGLDPKTGALRRLRCKKNSRELASPKHLLGLFSWQTFSKQDFDRFLAAYVVSKAAWAPQDFGKPNIENFGAASSELFPSLANVWSGRDSAGHRMVAELKMAGLDRVFLEFIQPASSPVLLLNLSWFGKTANRLPEAAWLSFRANLPDSRGWVLDKVDRPVSPLDVVAGGSRHMHAVSTGLRYRDAQGNLALETLDAPVVVLGEKTPLGFSNLQPDPTAGFHVSLFNNAWGTNYPQWFGEDMRFRFRLVV
jgi:hypothetical protein